LRQKGLAIRNPAYFEPSRMEVVVSSDLSRLKALQGLIDADHDQRSEELFPRDRALLVEALAKLDDQLEASGYSEAERTRIKQLALARRRAEQETFDRQVRSANGRNSNEIHHQRQSLQQRLYHEAFHAYAQERSLFTSPVGRISNPSDADEILASPHDGEPRSNLQSASPPNMPLWLAEGLAQIFESALFEADDLLRIDAPDAERLARLQADLASDAPLRLADLLAADPSQFLVPHDASGRTSARHYLYAWGLAYYLVFEQADFTHERLRDYAASEATRQDPVAAFEKLVGRPLDEFEAQWRQAMRDRL
jgi:hypothetical protein